MSKGEVLESNYVRGIGKTINHKLEKIETGGRYPETKEEVLKK